MTQALKNTCLIFVGMPGAGKSTIARHLAKRLQMPVVDTDSAIEERIGTSIREYFEFSGEAAFRDLEQKVIAELVKGEPCVMATGGGAVLRETNRQALRAGGIVVYLRLLPDLLYQRLKKDTKRPLLQVSNPLERLKSMFSERDPLYRECAHLCIDIRGQSLSILTQRLIRQIERFSQRSEAERASINAALHPQALSSKVHAS